MVNYTTTKKLLETYYKGFAKKGGWESVISDDFEFRADNMENEDINKGKEVYVNIIARFSRVYQNMRVKRMIIDGDNASVIANYDYIFPNGKHISGDVAEFWTAKDGKLTSLHIYFDTLTFDKNTPKK
ncbi:MULTISPECIES: nuclear transport factor 2 family protein [Arenibacter]|uniref:nuclear transport factor 2 family protein n=1 Tax=Arenibacter TaxID=178469 RepID=UPI001C072299|nr:MULTISPECIES: nuclear transport factor 2 family protein [Arenibacter]MBU2906398.1 nuclear transport factor 2 family protein [Arenibacter algicola]MCK0136210.1 nuclear transport factor 2 family protein [Arenibacter sp. S6351L]